MRKALALLSLLTGIWLVPGTRPAHAGSEEIVLRLLLRKGIITQQEFDELRKELEAETAPPPPVTPAAAPPAAPAAAAPVAGAPATPTAVELVDRLRDEVREELRRKDAESIGISLLVEGEVRYRSSKDLGDKSAGSSTELFLRRAQVAFEAKLLDWVRANLVLTTEFLGAGTTDQGNPPDESVVVDEATITLQSDTGFPPYLVVGQRTQPFGAFFAHFVSDPMSQDAYEIKQVGATVGYAARKLWGLDLSLTVYRQEEQMDHLFESGLFDSTAVVRSTAATPPDGLESFIAAVRLEPYKNLTLGAGYLTEPGEGTRNQTVGVWAGYTWGPLTVEGEFYAALARERYVLAATGEPLSRAFEEKVLVAGLAYRPIKALEIAGRYERFWDDGLADAAGVWSIANRFSVGVGYTIYEKDEISVRPSFEYRYSDLRRGGAARDTAAPDQHEIFGKLSVSYK